MDCLHDLGANRLSGRGLAALILMACTAPMAAAQTPASCADLAGMAIPASAIGLPTTGGAVTSAAVVPAAGAGAALVAEYCRVNAQHLPRGPLRAQHPLPRRPAHQLESKGADVWRRRLRRQHSQRHRQRSVRRDRQAPARDARLCGFRQRFRSPGRRERLAGRLFRPE